MEISSNDSLDYNSSTMEFLSESSDDALMSSSYSPTLITVVIMLSTFSIVGVIGNAIAFYIFFRRRNSSTSVIFILTLAGTDFFTCLITIPYTVVFELLRYHLFYDIACKTYMFLITSTVPFSAYIMVGIALDRYFCICHPFLHAVNIARAKVIIFCMGIPALGFGIITALSYGTFQWQDEVDAIQQDYNLTHGVYITESELLLLKRQFMDDNNLYLDHLHDRFYQEFQSEHYYNRNNMSMSENITNATFPIKIAHYGQCIPNNFVFSAEFLRVYQVVHALNFAIAYVAVATLYSLIYKTIYTRRARKAKRRKTNLYFVEGGKEAKIKKETLQTDFNSDNGPSLKMANTKDRRDQVGLRKIVPTIKNDLGVGIQPARLAPSEPGEDETASLLSKIEANNTKGGVPQRSLALCEKVYDGRDSDEGETEMGHLTPMNPKGVRAMTTNNLDLTTGQTEGWPEAGQGSQLVPLLRKDPVPQPTIDVGQDPHADKKETNRNPTSHAKSNQRNGNVNLNANSNTHCADSTASPKQTYTLPYPHEESMDVESTSLTTDATTSPAETTKASSTQAFPPTSLALKSPHAPAASPPDNEPKHKSKHWQTDGQTNSIKRKRPSTVRDRNLMANIKTAIMLFIVILVFLVAFLPSLLMANKLIPFHLIVFYGHFVYNVVNPFIYAFMNQTFREDLRKILNVCGR